LVFSLIIGVCIGITTGFIVELPPQTGIPGNKFFGWPIAWRISEMEADTEIYSYFKLFVDCVFWMVIVLVIIVLFAKVMKNG